MHRRSFITLLGGAAATWSHAARAQQPASKLPRIGLLSPGHPESTYANSDAFQRGLRELGYTEGQNIAIERRYGEWKLDRLQSLAAELVASKVDLIVASSTTAARVAKQATGTIPIVAIAMADPIEDDLVASLARPGGNVTGTTFLGPELVAKRLQLLRDVMPGLLRVAALWHPRAYSERTMAGILKEVEIAGPNLGIAASTRAGGWPRRICQRVLRDDQRARRRFYRFAQPDVVWRTQENREPRDEQPPAAPDANDPSAT